MYVCLVVAKSTEENLTLLCQAPRFTNIQTCDLVSVEDYNEDFTVIAADTFSDDSDGYKFIRALFPEQKELPKVIARMVTIPITYEEDEADE